MGLFDFFKKNKNISNDNGLNEEYFNGNIQKRFYKKNGKLDGLFQFFSQGNILYEITYLNGVNISSKYYNKDGWIEKTIAGNIIYLFKSREKLLSFEDILIANKEERPTVEEIREKIKERNNLVTELALMPGIDLDTLAKTNMANPDIEKAVEEELSNRSKKEGVILKNGYAFVDDDFPNPIRPFTGKFDGSNYINGKIE